MPIALPDHRVNATSTIQPDCLILQTQGGYELAERNGNPRQTDSPKRVVNQRESNTTGPASPSEGSDEPDETTLCE